MTAKQYIDAIQNDDQSAFTHLYESFREKFFGYFRNHYDKDDDYVADLYQDACVALWQNIQKRKLTPDNLICSLETYLIGIGKCILMARDRKYKELCDDSNLTMHVGEYSEESLRDEVERNEIIVSAVKNMGEPCSTLLDKYYWDELSGNEIAEQMNFKNTDVVKTQKYKCMQRLKTVLAPKIQDYKWS